MHSDGYLIDKIRKGNWRNYAVLVDKYKTRVFNFVLIIVKNREDAEEIVQDTFTKAFRSLHQFKGDARFSTWLLRIARNTSFTALRKPKPAKVELNEYDTDDLKVNGTSILAGADQTNVELILTGALYELTTDERTVITLYYLNECNIREIVEITSLTESNIKVLLHRSRKKLLSVLKKMGIEEWTN